MAGHLNGRTKYSGHVIGELSGLLAVGALLGFLFGLTQSTNRWSIALYAVVIALASAAVGGLIGLLFGIPRALANAGPPPTPPVGSGPDDKAADTPAPKTGGYAGNTNLEQVSDWLTKLLLGAGLTQLARLPGALNHLGAYLAPGLGGGDADSFAVVLVVYNLLVGFFLAFLAARLKLGAAFKEADELAAAASAANTAIGLLPPAPVGPTMLLVPDDASPDKQKNALELAQQVQRIEQQTPIPAFDADAYRRLAQELVSAKLYQQGLQILELAMNQHPSDPSLPLYAGAIYGMYLSDYQSAEKYYRQALSIAPDFAPAYYDLACNSARKGDLSAARTYLVQTYSIDPSLRQQSLADPIWGPDQLNLRDSQELGDLLAPVADT